MRLQSTPRELRRLALLSIGATGLASLASAQASFSVDWHSVTVGTPNTCSGVPITEGDILRPTAGGGASALGPLTTPCIAISAGVGGLGLALHGGCVGHPGGTPCAVEVDALSYGLDHPLGPNGAPLEAYLFSTDEFAGGGIPPVLFPSLASEAPVGDSSSDVWIQGGPMPPGPLPPFAAPVGHVGVIDGDGLASGSGAAYPGTGLIEPNPAGFPNLGDNLDALDFDTAGIGNGFPPLGVYFSLDAAWPDFLSGTPNSGSAPAHGFSGADILFTPFPGAAPAIWAPGPALGLNLSPNQQDDLDALAIWENGSGAFEPSQQPYDWTAGGTDMVLFSVRRGSPVIGMPDSIFGIPIAEGDILTTPLATAAGGVSPFPGIFCAAENLGLMARTAGAISDDLNALDTRKEQFNDCNGNGIPDGADLLAGTSSDLNANGLPDECELIATPFCFCTPAVSPCGNPYAPGGCRNTTGVGGLLGVSGSGSVTLDDLLLHASQLPPGRPGLFFYGTTAVGPLPFGDGLRCAGGPIRRTAVTLISPAGTLNAGPGIAAAGPILAGSSRVFQSWYRDPGGPCLSGFNTTNAYRVLFTL